MRIIWLALYIFIIINVSAIVFAQIPEEEYQQDLRQIEQERTLRQLEEQHLQKELQGLRQRSQDKTKTQVSPKKINTQLNISFGYDTNPNLNSQRKGDIFEEFTFSLDFRQPVLRGLKFILDYDLYSLNYSEFTDLNVLLNHLRFVLDKKITLFNLGTGYDLSIFHYLRNEDIDSLFHKGFLYLRHNLSNKFYHQLQLERGLKQYFSKKALAEDIDVYQDNKRKDERYSIEYILSALALKKLFLSLRTKFLINDSNAKFMDLYDYESYQVSPRLIYNILKNLYLSLNLSYTRKEYDNRIITVLDSEDKQKDDLYVVGAGIKYQLNKNNLLSLNYTYRQNSSNEPFEEYIASTISCGWQYRF